MGRRDTDVSRRMAQEERYLQGLRALAGRPELSWGDAQWVLERHMRVSEEALRGLRRRMEGGARGEVEYEDMGEHGFSVLLRDSTRMLLEELYYSMLDMAEGRGAPGGGTLLTMRRVAELMVAVNRLGWPGELGEREGDDGMNGNGVNV